MNTFAPETQAALLEKAPAADRYLIRARTFHLAFHTADSVCQALDGRGLSCGKPSSIDANAYAVDAGAKEEIGYAQFCASCFHSKFRDVFGIPDDARVDMPDRL